MDIIPAIDLMDGKCVRLIQGQYDQQISYDDNPVRKAEEFLAAGAKWLHIIDLDGARTGEIVNIEAIRAIAGTVDMKIEVGGGIRDEGSITKMLDIGVERVIIGTRAVKEFDWFAEMANKFAGRVTLGLDAKGSNVVTHGWTQNETVGLWTFASRASNLPLAAIIYTDITKDGMMDGPNFERTKALVEAVDIDVVAAGGVTEIGDITKLKEIGVAGAIIGRALYEGRISVAEAIRAERAGGR